MKLKLLCLSILTIFLFSACSEKEVIPEEKPKSSFIHTYSLKETTIELAKGLTTNLKMNEETGDIAITTFVELKNFKKTSKFGRILSESIYHELYSRGINLLDFRVKKALSIDAYGEYFLSRKISRLNKQINSTHILVGTYSHIESGLAINARIINTQTGKIITSSRVIFNTNNCKLLDNCKPSNTLVKLVSTKYKMDKKK